ncbi:probable serine/threonine-protein kinase fhkB [Tetranychus urticae]|uniref:probable serine/threonine-protein kinase fhkB n=1 Tax=Tetranychus urticae TaxID=32264 RepID=UPI00077BFB2D|nr:probable serine/threonine-protein kinase fhkB [Tetranychus urticae]
MKSYLLGLLFVSFVFLVTAHHHHCHKHKCCKKEVHHHHDHEGKKVFHKHGHGHGHKHSHSHANHHHHHHKHDGHSHDHGHQGYQQNIVTHQLVNKGNPQTVQRVQGSLLNNLLTNGAQNGAILFRTAQNGNVYQAVQQGVQNGQQATRAYILQQPGLAELGRNGKLAEILSGNRVILV